MPPTIDTISVSADTKWMTWVDTFLYIVQPMLAVVLLLRFSSLVDAAGFLPTISLIIAVFFISFITVWSACSVMSRRAHGFGFKRIIFDYSSRQFALSLTILYIICLTFASSCFISAASEAILHLFSLAGWSLIDAATNDLRICSAILCILVLLMSMVHISIRRPLRVFVFTLTIIAIFLHLSGVLFHDGEYYIRRIPEKNAWFLAPGESHFASIFTKFFPASMCGMSIINYGSKLQMSAPRGSLLAVTVAAMVYIVATMVEFIEVFAEKMDNTTDPKVAAREYAYSTTPIALIATLACLMSALTFFKHAAAIFQSLSNRRRFVEIRTKFVLLIGLLLISMCGSYDILCIPSTVAFLIVYSLFNFYVFKMRLRSADEPTPPPIALIFTSFACLCVSFLINYILALIFLLIFIIPYTLVIYLARDRSGVDKEKPSKYVPTLEKMHELQLEACNPFQPQILLLTGNPAARPALVDFAHSITRGQSLLVCGYVIPQDPCSRSYLLQLKIDKQMDEWLKARQIRAFGAAICCADQADGVNTLLQTVGLGRLRPNILMLGFKTNWDANGIADVAKINEYYKMLSNAFEKKVGLMIFRNEICGFDVSSAMVNNDGEPIRNDEELADYVNRQTKFDAGRNEKRQTGTKPGTLLSGVQTTLRKFSMAPNKDVEVGRIGVHKRFQVIDKHSVTEKDHKSIMAQMYRFRTKITNARIDVYWLRETGGLTMLVPYLLTQAGSFLEGAHIRVFTKSVTTNNTKKINEEQKSMASILRKFNIDSSDLHILNDFNKPPSQTRMDEFNAKIAPFRVARGVDKLPGMFDDDELFNIREKTRNYLRASEIIDEFSTDADLIVVTLPSARPDIPASIYLTWCDFLSCQQPPTCLLRGNQVPLKLP